MASGFRWVKPPEAELIPNIQAYGNRVMVAVKAVADFWAQRCQADMRQSAPWQDRTGNARSGLFSLANMGASDLVSIYLSHGHTVYYGVFLELSHGKRYAVIMPTLQRNLPELERMLARLFG
jgi:hypothetical protein